MIKAAKDIEKVNSPFFFVQKLLILWNFNEVERPRERPAQQIPV